MIVNAMQNMNIWWSVLVCNIILAILLVLYSVDLTNYEISDEEYEILISKIQTQFDKILANNINLNGNNTDNIYKNKKRLALIARNLHLFDDVGFNEILKEFENDKKLDAYTEKIYENDKERVLVPTLYSTVLIVAIFFPTLFVIYLKLKFPRY